MSEPKRVEITLLGQTLVMRTEASPEYLKSLTAYLEERVASLRRGGVRDPMTSLALAALDITDELFRARDNKQRDDGDVEARLGALLTFLERMTPREGRPRESPST